MYNVRAGVCARIACARVHHGLFFKTVVKKSLPTTNGEPRCAWIVF